MRRLLLILVFLCISSGAWAACVPNNAKPGSTGCQPVATSMAGTDYVTIWKPGSFPGSSQIISLNDMLLGRAGFGTVNSVGLQLPNIFNVTGSPVTGTGNLVGALANQNANLGFFGPASGPAAPPGFRAMVPADMPLGTNSAPGALQCDAVTTGCSGGLVSVIGGGVNTTVTDGTHSFAAQPILQFTGATVSNATGKVIVTITAAASSIAPGVTTISGGTNGFIEYNNSGTLGELATTGSGSVVRATSPTLVTPALGVPTALGLANATGTPSAIGLANGTGLPIAGLTGLGTGVGTALAAGVTGGGNFVLQGGPTITGAAIFSGNPSFTGVSQTFANASFRILGTGAGYNTLSTLNGGGTNYLDYLPGANGNLTYLPSGVVPVNTHCVVWSGTVGAQGDSGAPCGGSVSFSDGLGDGPYAASSVNLLGGFLTNPSSGVVTYTPSTPTRIVTSSGGTCASIGATTAAVCASDAGGIIYVNAPSLTIAVSALSGSYLPAGQSVTVCYQYATGSTAISSANQIIGFTTTGAGPYVATINAPQNGAMSCAALQSDGTYLKMIFAPPQNVDFLTVADQIQTGGHIKPGLSLSATSGSIAIDCGAADLQYLTDNGAISLSMANNGECTVQVLMGASAGAITPVGATVGSNTGDYAMASLPTTVSTYALLKLKQINGIFSYTTQYLAAASSSFGLAAQTASWGATQTATSGAANMTAAKIIYFAATWNATAAPTVTPTDSSSNTWTALATCTVGGNAVTKIWYSIYPTVSGTQTFTITSTANSYFNAQVLGFSGPPSGIAIDGSQACNNAGNAPTVQAGSITPAGAGDVFVFVGNSTDAGAALSIASPFNQTASVASSGGSLGFLMAYFINTGSSAQNPQMTISGGTNEASAAMSAAKP